MKFSHLHVHSHYSLLDGLAKIDQLLDTCKELGMNSMALTDHGTMYGAVEFFQKAKKKGIKPIIGCEVYLAPNGMLKKRPNIDNKPYHLVLLVKNQQGYSNLVKLVTKANLEGFYYKPRIDKELLKKYSDGLIGLSACIAGEIPRTIYNNHPEKAEKLSLEYQNIFGPGNFYLELQHHPSIKEQESINKELIKISKKHNIPLVATNDVHYLKKEDAEAHDVLLAVQTDKKTSEQNRLTMKNEDFSFRPSEQMIQDFSHAPEAIENTQKIADKCDFEFELGTIQLPHFDVPSEQTPDEYLRDLCKKGLEKKYPNTSPETINRFDYELEIIKKMGYASYFLIVQDFINWAKQNNIIVGPGRGSAAGSIVSYLLNITEIDPLKYDLLFERFLNPDRVSMPDIDLDFADERRGEVIDYVSKKYGKDHVAQIITFGTMAARGSIRDAGRAMDYPYNICDQTAKMIPFGMSIKQALKESSEFKNYYNSDEQAKKLIDMAMKLEGVARHASTHAAGVLITKDPLDKTTPCQYSSQKDGSIVSQYEMHSVEDLGLLKMDFLGLKTLTVIQNTLNQIEKQTNNKIDLTTLPLNDSETFKLCQQGNTTGVFQLESNGFKRYLKELKPTQFEDIIAMVALYRPGPMEFIPEFIARKHGLKRVTYIHPDLEPILKPTYGICVYQEQLMHIARDLAGFTPGEADVLRKAVGKKIIELLNEQKTKMIDGMIKNNINKQIAVQIWQMVEPFAQYGFNKAHATCYAMIGYQTAYLKTHYPTEFMSALIASEKNDIERIAFLVDECKKMDIKVLPPNINESYQNFAKTDEGIIRFGLEAVKNVGHNIVQTIIEQRQKNGQFNSISDFIERISADDGQNLNKKSLESLIRCGALDSFGDRGQLLASVEQMLNFAREIQKTKQSCQTNLFAGQSESTAPSFKLAQIQETDKKIYLTWEKELLGLYISEHPLNRYSKQLDKITTSCCSLSQNQVGQKVKVGGIINNIKKIITKTGQPMLFVEIEDTSGRIEAVVFPKVLQKTANAWEQENIAIVSGRLNDRDGNLKILCDNVKILE
ncbi:DNA polymerase III subunit alpha [Patescibacteria group bacterium]